ncbi:MAG: PIN domain-containing protein [Pyrinomonadaceae bacterium]|nr:PIN domain-containing protein [Pyrinomonadaceae bacterium]
MKELTAILDANVIYPAPLRDLLVRLSLSDAFRARWSETIHEEWMRNVLANRSDLTIEQLTRTKELMNKAVRDCLVEGFESLIDKIELPDTNDRHVLAAAIHVKADVIVTFNLKDFPVEKLAPFGVEAIHPDAFIVSLIEENSAKVLSVVKGQQESLKNPPRTITELLQTLEANGIKEAIKRMGKLLETQTASDK